MSEVNKVTDRNTKNEIFEAYKQAIQKLQDLESRKFDPVKEKQEKINESAVTAVENVETEQEFYEETMNNLLEYIKEGSLRIQESYEFYKNAKLACEVKEKQLKELFDIEVEANSLAALIAVQEEYKANYEAEKKALKDKWEADIDVLKDSYRVASQQLRDGHEELKRELEKQKQRLMEEYQYEFNRKKQLDNDTFEDECAKRRKEFEASFESRNAILDSRIKEIEDREKALKENENYMKDLEAKVAQIDSVIEKEVKAAEGKLKGILESKFKYEMDLLQKASNCDLAILESKLENKENELETLRDTNETLTRKLDEAYVKLEKLAEKTVEGYSNQKMISILENANNKATTNNVK